MAWGDIKYDHSDIFTPTIKTSAPSPRNLKPRKKGARILEKTKYEKRQDELFAFIERAGSVGVTAQQVLENSNFKYKSSAGRALASLMADGRVVRSVSPPQPGKIKPPFLYKVKR